MKYSNEVPIHYRCTDISVLKTRVFRDWVLTSGCGEVNTPSLGLVQAKCKLAYLFKFRKLCMKLPKFNNILVYFGVLHQAEAVTLFHFRIFEINIYILLYQYSWFLYLQTLACGLLVTPPLQKLHQTDPWYILTYHAPRRIYESSVNESWSKNN